MGEKAMEEKRIAAALIDVGGTLWSESPPGWDNKDDLRISALREAIPTLPEHLAHDLVEKLLATTSSVFTAGSSPYQEADFTQDTHGIIREVGASLGLELIDQQLIAIRKAMVLPSLGFIELFDGAHELLKTASELSLRCIVVSNALWRGGEEYGKDFVDLGQAAYVHGVVSSVDVGFRKPHPAMFQVAMAMAGCTAGHCVLIGNSERNDVLPALSLGMRAIRVAIEEPKPATSAANAVVTSLSEAAAVLRSWMKR